MKHVVYATFEVDHPIKIVSVNSLYKAMSSRGKAFAWLYKDKKVKVFQEELKRQAEQSPFSKLRLLKDKIEYMNVHYVFLLDKNIMKRDVSNLIKIVEDALMDITEIDDSKHLLVSASKALSPTPKKEFITCYYEVFTNENG